MCSEAVIQYLGHQCGFISIFTVSSHLTFCAWVAPKFPRLIIFTWLYCDFSIVVLPVFIAVFLSKSTLPSIFTFLYVLFICFSVIILFSFSDFLFSMLLLPVYSLFHLSLLSPFTFLLYSFFSQLLQISSFLTYYLDSLLFISSSD